MLKYTGHPLVDVGIATITAFAGKDNPAQLDAADLNTVADYIEREYVRQPLKSFLTVAFTSNAWFSQDAYNPDKPKLSAEQRDERRHKRQVLANAHLRQWQDAGNPSATMTDIFTGAPVANAGLSSKLPPGKAARAQIPLTTGDTFINFFPNGVAGLPISGLSLLALQAFPLGCAKCSGRLLVVHSDNESLMQEFAKIFLADNRRAVQLAQAAGSKKLPEPALSHRSLLIDKLLKANVLRREAREDDAHFSITAYHLTNSGQGAALDIYHLPLQTIGFLHAMYSDQYRHQWAPIVKHAWELRPQKGKRAQDFQPRYNAIYEDLFGLEEPQNAVKFLRTYFLRLAVRYARGKTDPRSTYTLKNELSLVSWSITAYFLRRIMNMDKERIDEIRTLGDKLADYVSGQNDKRFFRDFFTARKYGFFRAALIKANTAHVRRGNAPFITLDPYITVFEEGDGIAYTNWQLARDLVLIRMVEQLYAKGWFQSNADVLEAPSEEKTA